VILRGKGDISIGKMEDLERYLDEIVDPTILYAARQTLIEYRNREVLTSISNLCRTMHLLRDQ